MSILFYGDPHGQWQPLFEAVEKHRPDVVILLGDMDLDEPLRVKLVPVWDMVPAWRYIHGNHDTATMATFDNLLADFPTGSLHGKTDLVDDRIVGGLGGVFKGKVWSPRFDGDDNTPKIASKADMLKQTARIERWRNGLPLWHRNTIFPDDVVNLTKQHCDILVTHEGPSSHPHGFVGIDDLAHAMGARLVVHGHLHHDYSGHSKHGIHVRGVGEATPWLLDESLLDGDVDPGF